jgi:hypothetical protein
MASASSDEIVPTPSVKLYPFRLISGISFNSSASTVMDLSVALKACATRAPYLAGQKDNTRSCGKSWKFPRLAMIWSA